MSECNLHALLFAGGFLGTFAIVIVARGFLWLLNREIDRNDHDA